MRSNFMSFIITKKFDIAFVTFMLALAFTYSSYVSRLYVPIWDGAIYLENAQNWLRNEPLVASYRPPLISWIIAGLWSVAGEDWTIARFVQPIFTISTGLLLYRTLRKYKGDQFAFGVTALTMLNSYVFMFSTQILTEGLSLFFLILSISCLKSEKRSSLILAGIAIGLTFGSRYPIFVLAFAIFMIELFARTGERKKIFVNTVIGILPVMLLIILAVYAKSGTFSVAIERDTQLSIILSPFYLEKFIRIFGFISILVPAVFLFKRTFIDRYNYAFIGYFAIGFLLWSAISENQQERFMIQMMPAAYFLVVLAIQNIWKSNALVSVADIKNFTKAVFYMLSTIVMKWLSFFPIRYYLCGFIIACLTLSYRQYIVLVQEDIVHVILQFFSVTSTFVNGELSAEILGYQVAVVIPIYIQLTFLIFFPTIATVSRINFKRRMQFMLFGLLCFLVFVAVVLLSLFVPVGVPSLVRELISILITAVAGGLIIELSLWSAISIPHPIKIKRIVSRSYKKEYLLLLTVLFGSTIFTIYVFMFLQITLDSPVILYAFLTISSIPSVAYILGNLIYEINRQIKIKSGSKKNIHSQRQSNVSISFLIPAYNEAEIIGKCIWSIDRAAAKYNGKSEIIIVNDGSNDNTKRVVELALSKLAHAQGKLFNISNCGKGFALNYGLARTSGEIIFRMDADSLIDRNAIGAMVEHFDDSIVGSVSGFVVAPLEATSLLGKAQNVLFASYLYVKRAQEVFDSIIVQPGPCTAFRKDALLKIGGWATNQLGEDGEISSRISRFGYRSEFEQRSVFFSDAPQRLTDFLAQRSRWSIAYYHSRGRNLEQVKEIKSPRAFVFTHNLGSHGISFGLNFAWVLLGAALLIGNTDFFLADITPLQSFLGTVFIKLIAIHIIITGVQLFLYSYALKKVNRMSDIKYYPVMRFLNIILSMWVKIAATEAVLRWSSKWSKYNDEAFRDLRNYMHQSVDPNYPAADTKENIPRSYPNHQRFIGM